MGVGVAVTSHKTPNRNGDVRGGRRGIARLVPLDCVHATDAQPQQSACSAGPASVTSTEMTDVSGRWVFVSGGARGIGFHTAKLLLARHAKLIVVDNCTEALQHAEVELRELGEVLAYECDVSDVSEFERVCRKVQNRLGEEFVSIVVHNVAIVNGQPVEELSVEQLRRSFDINVLSWYTTLRMFLPEMKRRRLGHIVTMSSVVAFIPGALMSDYCGTKAALESMHNCLRLELWRDGLDQLIHTTSVHPFLTQTGLFSGLKLNMGWLVAPQTPEDVASAVVDGMIFRRQSVFVPKRTGFMCSLLSILPVCLQDYAVNLFGGVFGMDSYIGRKKDI